MSAGVALALLGLGLGAIVIAGRPQARSTPYERAETLRVSAIDAQREAARASSRARDLVEQWRRAEDARS